jgi:hypothetical protein
MRRLFIMATAVVAIVSCKEATPTGPEYYFDKEVSRLYNDPTAEMDTLSYAAGMNLGLVMSLQNADFDIDTEAIIAGLDKELKSTVTDQKRFDKVNEYMTEYSTNIVSPYMRTKQMNSRIVTDRPDTLSLPELYNETYTREAFADALVVIFADGMRKQRLPINLHWAYQAIRDAKAVESKEDIDTVMALCEAKFKEVLSGYVQRTLPAYNLELSQQWLERVSAKSGVEELTSANGEPAGVYYRINRQGGTVKPENDTDSIGVKYAVYSRTGKLLESNEMFIDNLKKQREQVSNNKMLPDSIRNNYIKQIDEEIAKSDIRQLPLERFMQKDVQSALKLVGKGGNITMWMDATKAFGYRAGRLLPANEGVVINVELLDLKTIAPALKPVTGKKPTAKGDKASIVASPRTVKVENAQPL